MIRMNMYTAIMPSSLYISKYSSNFCFAIIPRFCNIYKKKTFNMMIIKNIHKFTYTITSTIHSLSHNKMCYRITTIMSLYVNSHNYFFHSQKFLIKFDFLNFLIIYKLLLVFFFTKA